MSFSLPTKIVEAIKSDRLVVFVGSGMSKRFGLPDWKKMVIDVIVNSDNEKNKSFISVLENGLMEPIEVLDKMSNERNYIYSYIEDNFKVNADANLSCHKNIMDVCGKVVTTNYDDAFEKSVNDIYRVVYDSAFKISKLKNKDKYIFKIHGSCDVDPSHCVVFSKDYNELYSKENAAILKMKELFINNTILFIGFGFNDPYVNELFYNVNKMFDGNNMHYILTTTPDKFKKFEYLNPINVENNNQIDDFFKQCLLCKKGNVELKQVSNAVLNSDAAKDKKMYRIALLHPDPVDIKLASDAFNVIKAFDGLNIEVSRGWLNINSLQKIEDYDLLVIVSKVFKGKIYIEDENIKSQLISAGELFSYLLNDSMAKILITDDNADLSNCNNLLNICTYKLSVINKVVYKIFRSGEDATAIDKVFSVRFMPGFKLIKGNMVYSNLYGKRGLIDYTNKSFDNVIGRLEEQGVIASKLISIVDSGKLLNIKGAGGTGKTTIAKKVAYELYQRGYFDHGVSFVSCEHVKTYDDLEDVIVKAFKLQSIINFKEYLLENVKKHNALIILDNFETVTTSLDKYDLQKTIALLEFVTDYASIMTTSREVIGVDFEDLFNMSSMTTDDAVLLFVKYYGQVDDNELRMLRFEILEDILNNNPLAIKLVTSNTVRQPSLVYLRSQLMDSFFELTATDFEKIFSRNADLNIERTKSIYHSINYSYSKLLSKEKLAFELLHLFPDGISLPDFKKCFRGHSGGNRITESDLRHLNDKSLVENYDGVLQLQPIIRRFAEFQFSKRSIEVKQRYYNDAYVFNCYIMEYLDEVYKRRNINTAYKLQYGLRNNLSLVLEYLPSIEVSAKSSVTDKEQLLNYVTSYKDYIVGEIQVTKLKDQLLALKEYFNDLEYAEQVIDASIGIKIYYLNNFDDTYNDLCELFPAADMEKRNIGSEDNLEYSYKSNISFIHSMEGYTINFINSLIMNNYIMVGKGIEAFYDHLFYLGIHYSKSTVGGYMKDFYDFEVDYAKKRVNKEEIKKHIDNVFSEYHLEIMQSTYVLAKVEGISKDSIKKLVVTNPYTLGLKNLMYAFDETDELRKKKYFDDAISNLIHIKYYYLEAIYYYCKFLNKINDKQFDEYYNKGLNLCRNYRYQYLEYRFNSITDPAIGDYQCDFSYWRWSKGWFPRIGGMIQTTLNCGKCGSTAVRKNGHSKGKAKYLCTACRHQAAFEPAAPRKAAQYAQVEKLLLERVSQRAIVRLTGVARMTVAKLAKKSPLGSAGA